MEEKMSRFRETEKDECTQVVELKAQINAKLLKDIVNIQHTIADEGKIFFNGKYIEFNDVDPANVAMIIQKIPVEQFLEYHNTNDITLGLSFDRLTSILKGSKKDSIIKMDYNEEDGRLITQIGAFNQKITLIDPDELKSPKTPNLILDAKVTLNMKEFYEFLCQADKVSDHIEISTHNKMLYLFAENDMTKDQVLVKYDKAELKQFEVRGDLYASLFSVDYLKNTVKFLKVKYDEITLLFGTDNPLRIECRNGTETIVLLAPRIEDEAYGRFDRIKRGYENILN
jgi:DNA polymerase III sliding clamp (beta) subunit (PCNA family)